MINSRFLVTVTLGSILFAAPMVRAQTADGKPIDNDNLNLEPLSVSAPIQRRPDLSRYRQYQFGMSLPAVAKLADIPIADARVIHKHSALIQELDWKPQGPFGSVLPGEPVSEALFSFYNGQLFRIMIRYNRASTEGLSDEDMVEIISQTYGSAVMPDKEITLYSAFEASHDSFLILFQTYGQHEKIRACWEDSQYSFNLVRSSIQPEFGLGGYSKALYERAQAAIASSTFLEERDVAQSAIERQKQQDGENRAAREIARVVNKMSFRP